MVWHYVPTGRFSGVIFAGMLVGFVCLVSLPLLGGPAGRYAADTAN